MDCHVCRTPEQLKKWAARRNFKMCRVLNENIAYVYLSRSNVTLNRHPAVGVTILNLSKEVMYRFYYEYFRPSLGSSLRVNYSDTDSLVLQWDTRDYAGDLEKIKQWMDTSNLPKGHRLWSDENKGAAFLFKNETPGRIITEGVFLVSVLTLLLLLC